MRNFVGALAGRVPADARVVVDRAGDQPRPPARPGSRSTSRRSATTSTVSSRRCSPTRAGTKPGCAARRSGPVDVGGPRLGSQRPDTSPGPERWDDMAPSGPWNEDRDVGVGFDFERDLLCTADADGYFTSLNGGWERVLGWTGEELTSRVRCVDFVHPADREPNRDADGARCTRDSRGRPLREPLPRPRRRLALAALERSLRRRGVVRGRVRHHRAQGDRAAPAGSLDRRSPARLQPADPRPAPRKRGPGGAPGAAARRTRERRRGASRRPSSCRTSSAAG